MSLPFSNRRLTAISSKWSGPYIITEMSIINECYIAEYEDFSNEMKLLGFVNGNDAQIGRDSDDIQDQAGAGSFAKTSIICT